MGVAKAPGKPAPTKRHIRTEAQAPRSQAKAQTKTAKTDPKPVQFSDWAAI